MQDREAPNFVPNLHDASRRFYSLIGQIKKLR